VDEVSAGVSIIDLPDHRADRPNRDFLEWHLDEVFKAS
jgi:putative restriction endonuclease